MSVLLEQLYSGVNIQAVRKPDRACILSDGFATGAETGCTSCSLRRVADYGVAVADDFGVMRNPRRVTIGLRKTEQRIEHAAVHLDAATWQNRLQNRDACELVTERVDLAMDGKHA